MVKKPSHFNSRSKTQQKIMLFFAENDGSVDTPRGISAWINENINTVRRSLEDLVESGFLKAHRTSLTIGYSCLLSKTALAKIYLKYKKAGS